VFLARNQKETREKKEQGNLGDKEKTYMADISIAITPPSTVRSK
jgi:hypothetical protein